MGPAASACAHVNDVVHPQAGREELESPAPVHVPRGAGGCHSLLVGGEERREDATYNHGRVHRADGGTASARTPPKSPGSAGTRAHRILISGRRAASTCE